MQPQSQPPPSAGGTRTRERSEHGQATHESDAKYNQVEAGPNRNLVLVISMVLFLFSGAALFFNLADTLPKQIFSMFSFSFSMGGFFSLLTGSARITLGKFGIYTGAVAIALTILLLILSASGLIKIDLQKAIELASFSREMLIRMA